jgi:hypothetical protein
MGSNPMNEKIRLLTAAVVLLGVAALQAQSSSDKNSDDPDARPPVTKADIRIVQRAKQILDSPAKWNRSDTRVCPTEAKSFSLYCALEKATDEVTGNFQHRSAAMQEARFVIDDIAPNRKNYKHRLMDYNNDPTTTFSDIQKVFRLLQDRISERLTKESPSK